MSVQPDAEAAPPPFAGVEAPGRRAAGGLFAGFAILALIDAAAIVATIPRPHAGPGLRAAHVFFEIAETLGVGAVAAAAVGLWSGRVRVPAWAAMLVFGAVTTPILYVALGDDLYRQAAVLLEGKLERVLFPLYVLLTGFAIPAAQLTGTLFAAHRRLRLLPIVVSLGAMVANHFLLSDDYFGLHCSVAWTAATLLGAALAPLVDRLVVRLAALPAGRIAGAAVGLVALAGLVVPPSNAVRIELFRLPSSLAPWVLASSVWRTPRPHAGVVPPSTPWFRDRTDEPPIPPTLPRLMPPNPVVVLITVDATRAEAINDPKNDVLFPTLTDLKRQGTSFPNASSPGSQTAVSLTALFSGRYFSELYWSMHGTGSTRFTYAADDPAVRFPALLGAHGVKTTIFCSINFLAGEFGVARGFEHERVIPTGRQHAFARQMIDPVLDVLRRTGAEPAFIYTHLMEPHAPYDRGRKDGTDYQRYLSEIAVADGQIGRVARTLQQRFPDRGVLIVSADHGEAFGEHETFQHTKTLYDELLRVPLLVRGRGIARRAVDQRVGLIDLGPTILDLFGLETPATFEGQSLVPLLAGHDRALQRPLLAEGRLRRALYTHDGLKVIDDPRRKIVEVYDLGRDPGELDNLFDADPNRSDPAVAALQTFFAAHSLRRPGYEMPYKP